VKDEAEEGVEILSDRVLSRVVGVAGLVGLLLLSGCEFLPAEFRSVKSPIRLSPLKHEVTVQPAHGMGPAPFKIDQARAGSAEVQLTLSNPTTSTIRIVWTEGTFITADSIVYSIGVKTDRDGSSTEPTIIEANSTIRVTVIALAKDRKPVTSGDKSVEAPYRVGLKLTAERALERWKGTVWVFVL
jgi:hypothetical protein